MSVIQNTDLLSRVHDKREGEKFISSILPPYLRTTPKIESLIPCLYLRGIFTGKISETHKEQFGETSMGLLPASVSRLLRIWETDFEQFKHRKISSR